MANQTLQLASLLRSEGMAVEVIQVNPPYWPRWIGAIPAVRALFRLLPYLVRLWQVANRVDLFHVMANSGWSWHLFCAPAIWIAKLRGKPVVINYRGGEADGFFTKALVWIKPSLDRTDAIIVPSGFLRSVFEKYGFTAQVVPNVINLGRFSAVDKRSSSLPGPTPSVLVARNLEPIYDNATALHAFSIMKQAFPGLRLVIAGSGPELQSLQKIAADLGCADDVTFTGRVNNEDMPALYSKAQVMINSSLVDNMPNSVLEALASGVPVVSTNVGGVPYVLEHERTGLLVPPGDPQAMANAALDLLRDPAKTHRFREAGIQSVQQYTWPNVRGVLLTVYQGVLAKEEKTILEAK
jgi:glycosyltransferase involved in cell wall biosynthesis